MPGNRGWQGLAEKPRAKLLATLALLGDDGECHNTERFKHERDKIYAIKAWKVRLYCFMTSDQRIVLTNLAEKKREIARKGDIDRAVRIRQECING